MALHSSLLSEFNTTGPASICAGVLFWVFLMYVLHYLIIGVFLLTNIALNYFKFNGKMYPQKQGTAMGTRMTPNYAIIFMHSVKQEILKNSKLKPMI